MSKWREVLAGGNEDRWRGFAPCNQPNTNHTATTFLPFLVVNCNEIVLTERLRQQSILVFQAFKGLKNLKKITLDHNKIQTIQPFAFKVQKLTLDSTNLFIHRLVKSWSLYIESPPGHLQHRGDLPEVEPHTGVVWCGVPHYWYGGVW